MPFTFDERPESRQSSFDPPTETLIYNALGEQDDMVVKTYAIAGTPFSIFTAAGILYRQDIRVDPVGWANYKVTVPYGKKKRNTGEYSFHFDTTGATVNIRCSRQHVSSYDSTGILAGADANLHKGAIGVQLDGEVAGVDVVIPCLKLSIDFKHPRGIVTIARAKHLSDCTGRYNDQPYLGFDSGELLFLGATGSDGTDSDAEVSYHFAGSPNTTTLKFDQILGITKKGWEAAWVEFKREEVNGKPTSKPMRVHIERVYEGLDFATAFGWS